MYNVRRFAMCLVMLCVGISVSACSNSTDEFYNAYSVLAVDKVGPLPLED